MSEPNPHGLTSVGMKTQHRTEAPQDATALGDVTTFRLNPQKEM